MVGAGDCNSNAFSVSSSFSFAYFPEIRTAMPTRLLTIRVDLRYAKPFIWRRIRVRDDITFYDLHRVLQIVFAWDGDHDWAFEAFGEWFDYPGGGYEVWEELPPGTEIDEEPFPVDTALSTHPFSAGTKFSYTYDFGDNWKHLCVVEKVTAGPDDAPPAELLKAVRAAPPDDCGGMGGYQLYVEALAAGEGHPEYGLAVEILGEGFEAEAVDGGGG